MATEEAMAPSTVKEEIKEATLQYTTSHSLQDAPNKPKMRSLIRLSSCNMDLTFLNCESKRKCMSINPHRITKIEEPGKTFLCLEYGPEVTRPMFLLLDFTNEPRESFEEWNELLHKMLGLEYNDDNIRPRSKTANNQTLPQKPSNPSGKTRAISAFEPSITRVLEMPPRSNKGPPTPEVFESPPVGSPPTGSGSKPPPPSFPVSGSQSSGGASPGSDSCGSDISLFTSLKSTCFDSPQLEEIDCTKDSLSQHVFKDYEGEIFVTKTIPGSKLNVGDMIDLKNAEFTKNARGLTEYIRTTAEKTIPLMVMRGVEITVNECEQGNITMNIRGSKIRRPDIMDVIMKTCHSCTNDESRLAIADINDIPVEAETQNDQVEQRLRDAFMQSPEGLRIRPIPRSLMRSNDKLSDDVHDDHGSGDGQDSALESRRIDVTGANNVSNDTKTADENEETEC